MSILSTKFYALICMLIMLSWGNSSLAELESPDESVQQPKKYYVEDIKKAMMDYIATNVDDDGIYVIQDDKTGKNLRLKFVKIHDPVRVINHDTYFACTDFHVVGQPKKVYDLDFWMSPENGVLKIFKTKIHKEPRKSLLYGWYKQPRYTFVDDKVVPIY